MTPADRPAARDDMGSTGSSGISRRRFVTAAVGLGLAGASTATVLAGCSGDDKTSGPVEDPLAVKGGPASTPNPDVVYPEGYVGPRASRKAPIVKEKVTLRVVVPQDVAVGDWKRNAFTRWFEERTNVHIDWQVVAGGDEAMTKVNAMIAAGDIPDVFMNINFTNAQQLLYGSQGLFLPLNDLIEDYGSEVKRIFADYPDAKQLLTANDGNIYSMPYVNDCFHCNCGHRLWIYRPWLDQAGLQVPQTTEEFEEALLAFKNGDPNGNGKQDEIPLMSDSENTFDGFIMGSFLYNPGEPWLVLDENRKVDVTFNKPQWREGLRYLARLYRQGLIAKESFTQTNEQLQRIGNRAGEPILGAVRAFYWGSFLTIDDDDPKARWRDYVAVPTLAGPDGTRIAPWNYYNAVLTGRFVVTRACKYPAVAVQWADVQYELESILQAYNGAYGKGWRWAKPGEVGINGKQALWSTMGTWPPEDGTWWNQLGLGYRSNDFRLGEVVDPDNPTFEKPLYDQTREAYYPHRVDKSRQLPPLYMTEEQAAQTGEIALTLSNHVRQHQSKFILGELDIDDDAAWEKYVSTIDQMGLEVYLRHHQDAYDEKYA